MDEKGKPIAGPAWSVEGADEERRQREAEIRRRNRLAEREEILAAATRATPSPPEPAYPAAPVLATYGARALIVVASLLVGRAFLQVLGRRETWWLETSVGLAVLIVVCSVLTRVHFGAESTGSIPERAELALIACVVLVVASIAIYLRFSFVDRASFLMALPVVALTAAAGLAPVHRLGPPRHPRHRRQQRHGRAPDLGRLAAGAARPRARPGSRSAIRSARTGWSRRDLAGARDRAALRVPRPAARDPGDHRR